MKACLCLFKKCSAHWCFWQNKTSLQTGAIHTEAQRRIESKLIRTLVSAGRRTPAVRAAGLRPCWLPAIPCAGPDHLLSANSLSLKDSVHGIATAGILSVPGLRDPIHNIRQRLALQRHDGQVRGCFPQLSNGRYTDRSNM
jgi:hypothetical protein